MLENTPGEIGVLQAVDKESENNTSSRALKSDYLAKQGIDDDKSIKEIGMTRGMSKVDGPNESMD